MKSCFWPGSLLQSAIEVRTPIAKCCGGDSPLAGSIAGEAATKERGVYAASTLEVPQGVKRKEGLEKFKR
jgi:hypothetical protein